MLKDAVAHQKFLSSDNSTMLDLDTPHRPQEQVLSAERKTVRLYVMISSTCQMSGEQQANVLTSARAIYQAFERAFQVLSDQEKRCFVTTLRKLVIRSKLQNELEGKPLFETLILHQAVIIAHSLIEQMSAQDYRRMIKFFMGYGKAFDELTGEPTLIPVQMYTQLTHVFVESKLNPKIVEDIAPEIINMCNLSSARIAEQSSGMVLK